MILLNYFLSSNILLELRIIMLNMESAKNINTNVRNIAEEQGLKGVDIARLSNRYGGLSQKTVSNVMRADYDAASANIGVHKLDILAKTLKVSPQSLIMPPGSRDESFTQDELEASIRTALGMLAEMEVVSLEDHERLSGVADLIAAAQHSVLVKKETDTSTFKKLVKFVVR